MPITSTCRADLPDTLAGRAGPSGVRSVLCGPSMRDVLHRALLACLPPGSSVRARLHRSKFKPGRKLSAYYAVTVDGSEPDCRQIAASWTTAAEEHGTPASRGGADTATAEAELRDRGLAGPFSRLRLDDPTIGLRLLVAPLDPAFPQLARLCDPAYLRARLGAYQVRAIRYRPGQRHVLRLDPPDGGATLFVKVYAGRAAQVCATGAGMARLLGERSRAHPIMPTFLPEDQAVVWPAAPGAPLRWWLCRDPRAAAMRLPEAGALLRAIHDAQPDWAVAPAGRPVDDELAAITHTATHIGVLLPPIGAVLAEIMSRGGDRLASLPGEKATLVHGDFKADHLLVGPDRMTLIDLDRCAWSDPALDLAKFLADLRWWLLLSGRPGVAPLRARFLEGYGPCPGERLARLRVLEPLLLIKMAARRPRLHDPRWARLTTALVSEACRLNAEWAVPEAVA